MRNKHRPPLIPPPPIQLWVAIVCALCLVVAINYLAALLLQ